MFPLREIIHREAATRNLAHDSQTDDAPRPSDMVDAVEFYPEMTGQGSLRSGATPPTSASPTREYRITIPKSRVEEANPAPDPISMGWISEARAIELFNK